MENKQKAIGVLTSGGDAPGMNSAIRAVVRAALHKNMRVIGIRRGYSGLLAHDMFEMNLRSVSDTLHRGGTMLYSARCPEFRDDKGVERGKEACLQAGIDGLVVIGGDGSFRGARDLLPQGDPLHRPARHDRQRHRFERLYDRLRHGGQHRHGHGR